MYVRSRCAGCLVMFFYIVSGPLRMTFLMGRIAVSRICPRIRQEITSPAPTVSMKKGNAARNVIGVGEDKGDNEGVGYDRRNRYQPAVFPQGVTADGAQESCQCS